MINLRYHIVSITAVFLALGIGIAMGSSFLSDAAVDQVGRNIESTRNEARAARAEAGELREEVALRDRRDEELRDQAAARLFRDDLEGVPVLVLTVGGIDRESLDRLRTALDDSRADFTGTLTITDRVAAEAADAQALAGILDRDDASGAELRSALVGGVADELLAAAEPAEEEDQPDPDPGQPDPGQPDPGQEEPGQPDPGQEPGSDDPGATVPSTVPDAPAPDGDETTDPTTDPEVPDGQEAEGSSLIRTLVDAGVLDFQPGRDGLTTEDLLRQPGHRYVIVSGPGSDVSDGTFFRPLLRAMTEGGPAPVVVASAAVGDEAEETREVVVGPLLAEDVVAARITTVDHLESLSGLMATVLGLDDLGRDRRGHYGFAPSADSQLPAP